MPLLNYINYTSNQIKPTNYIIVRPKVDQKAGQLKAWFWPVPVRFGSLRFGTVVILTRPVQWTANTFTVRFATYKDALCMGMCPKTRLVVVMKKGRKDKLSCVKMPFWSDHPRRLSPQKLCMRLYISSFMKSAWGVLGAVEMGGRKLPSFTDLAHSLYNSLYCCTSPDNQRRVSTSKYRLGSHNKDNSDCTV